MSARWGFTKITGALNLETYFFFLREMPLQYTTERQFYTHKLTVISTTSNELITCFPGGYAPAFVSDWMSDREKTLSKSFWDQHLFKKYN